MNLILIFIGVALCLHLFYKLLTRKNDYFQKLGIPYMKPKFLIGNTGSVFFKRVTVIEFVQQLYYSFPTEKIIGLFNLTTPFYLLRDPDVIKQLLIKDFDHFEDHKTVINEDIDSIFGNTLFMLRGEKWRQMRGTLSPAFTGSKMRQMFELVTEVADEMSNYLSKSARSNDDSVNCEMKQIFSKYSNDVIASCAFGIKVNSFENDKNEFFLTGSKFLKVAGPVGGIKFLFLRMFPELMKKLNFKFVDPVVRNFFRDMALQNMETREREKIFRPDMINILMQVRKGKTVEQSESIQRSTGNREGFATVEESHIGTATVRRKWTDDEIAAQCFVFFVAGFETSSTVLSFLAHELAIHQDIQLKLYEEVLSMNKSLTNNKRISYEDLQKMTYMDAVISEILRFRPPANITDRVCVKEYNYDDGQYKFKMPVDMLVWIPIYGLHHDPKYFPNPEKFDPERFSDVNKGSIQPGTYLPFGVGPRNCIGSRFALMEVKAIVYYLLLNFSIEPNEKTQIPLKIKKGVGHIRTERGVHLTFKLRK